MALTSTIPYTIEANTLVSSVKLNANFDAIFDFVNGKCVQLDGTLNYDGEATHGAGATINADPTTANHWVRWGYAKGSPQHLYWMDNDGTRPTTYPHYSETTKWIAEAGSSVITFTAGAGALFYTTAFPTVVACLLLTLGDSSGASTNGVRLYTTAVWGSIISAAVYLGNYTGNARINYLALGW